MNFRSITKKYLNTTQKNTQLQVEVYYSRGGWNFGTGKDDQRGYWLSIQPVSFWEEAGVKMMSITLFSGLKQFLTATKADRKGGKTEQAALRLAEQYEKRLLEQVCTKENITLAA